MFVTHAVLNGETKPNPAARGVSDWWSEPTTTCSTDTSSALPKKAGGEVTGTHWQNFDSTFNLSGFDSTLTRWGVVRREGEVVAKCSPTWASLSAWHPTWVSCFLCLASFLVCLVLGFLCSCVAAKTLCCNVCWVCSCCMYCKASQSCFVIPAGQNLSGGICPAGQNLSVKLL